MKPLLLLCTLSSLFCVFLTASPEKKPLKNDEPPTELQSIKTLKKHLNSLIGMSIPDLKRALKGAKISEVKWDEEGTINGKEITAQYPGYFMTIFCSNNEVILSSLVLMSN